MMLTTVDRGKLRMEKIRQLELEQLQWEQEALVMPEDLNRALHLSFESVKTEFSDLDGLSWSRNRPTPWTVEEPTPKLTCAEIPDTSDARTSLHSPSKSDTIRASRPAPPSRSPLQPANQFLSPTSHKDPQGSPYSLRRQPHH